MAGASETVGDDVFQGKADRPDRARMPWPVAAWSRTAQAEMIITGARNTVESHISPPDVVIRRVIKNCIAYRQPNAYL